VAAGVTATALSRSLWSKTRRIVSASFVCRPK